MEEHSWERRRDEQKQRDANGNAPGNPARSPVLSANLMTLSRSPDSSEPQILYLQIGIITPIHSITIRF